MGKTVTFSFASSTFEGAEASETFTFEELEVDESLHDKELVTLLEQIHQTWMLDKLNVSASIIINEPDTQ